MRLVDTHAHLSMLEHDDLSHVLRRANNVGVERIITVSTEENNWRDNQRIAEENEGIYYTLGLHPHDAIRWTECSGNLEKLFEKGVPRKCVGIGELGLDFHYNFSPREIQMDVLEAQVKFAKRFELPVILHCRDAFRDLYDLLGRTGLSSRAGVMHCFTGGVAEAKEALDLGLMISFSGILTFKNSEKLREAAAYVPDESLLLETDCPYLAPTPYRGKPNEPAYIEATALVMAEVRKTQPDRIGSLTSENAIKFLHL